MNPTAAQIDGIARAALALLSGIALAFGIGDAAMWATISGSIGTLISLGWSIWSNSQAQLITEVARSPEIVQITTATPGLAESIPSPKVVSHDPVLDLH